MGKQRVAGKQTVVYVVANGARIKVGEVDKFSATSQDELKKSYPLGAAHPTSYLVNNGWELSFEGGKVDANLARFYHAQDRQVVLGRRSPYFEVESLTKHMDNTTETFTYKDVTLYNYSFDAPSTTEDIMEKMSGFAAYRETTDNIAEQATVVSNALSAMLDEASGEGLNLADASGDSINDAQKRLFGF